MAASLLAQLQTSVLPPPEAVFEGITPDPDFHSTSRHPGRTGRHPAPLQYICPDGFASRFGGVDSICLRSASRLLFSSRVATGFLSWTFAHSLSSLTRKPGRQAILTQELPSDLKP